MFDIGALELLLIAAVAIIVIGPKEMPMALRQAGRFVGKMRRISSQFRSGFDAMVREAELEEMEKEWKEKNRKIMAESAKSDTATALPPPDADDGERTAQDDGDDHMEPLAASPASAADATSPATDDSAPAAPEGKQEA